MALPQGKDDPNPATDFAIVFCHHRGDEKKADLKMNHGNDKALAKPTGRGFGHIAFNCKDVYKSCENLEKNGVKFQKKPDDGRMKGLAFALDPDGYWIEIVRREKLGWPEYYNLSQTMMRVKDGPATIEFYKKHFGMTMIRKMDMPQYKFTNYFLASLEPQELEEAMALDPETKHVNGVD